MIKNNRIEYWRNQTLINRIESDDDIAREYFALIEFVINNYSERMETIQAPLLHLISHCLELKTKAIVQTAVNNGYVEECHYQVVAHSHKLQDLVAEVSVVLSKMTKDHHYSSEDTDMIKSLPEIFQGLSKVLCVEASSYRYAYSLNKKQCANTKSPPFTEDNESPNIKTLWPLFKESYYASLYTIMLLDYLSPEHNS